MEESIDSSDTNPFRYCGEYYDSEIEQIYLRARYYDPSLGRFTQSDPAMSGANWYVYCSNNPILNVDPSGLDHYIYYAKDQQYEAIGLKESLLANDPNTPVHMIPIDNPRDFEVGWAEMGIVDGNEVSIDTVVINAHGDTENVYASNGQRLQFENLQSKEIDTIVLHSCNTGNIDYDNNVAVQLIKGQNVNNVIAPDGYDAWYPMDYVNPTRGVYSFSALRYEGEYDYSKSPRDGAGYCLYQNKNGSVYITTNLTKDLERTTITSLIKRANQVSNVNLLELERIRNDSAMDSYEEGLYEKYLLS